MTHGGGLRLAPTGLLALLAALVTASAATEPLPPLAESVARIAAAQPYTPAGLAEFDGSDPDRPILLAVRGVVFDVSEGRDFYGPGGDYHVLAGRDVTRAIARWSLSSDDLNDRCDDLSQEQWKSLERIFEDTYLAQYPVVGHVKGGFFFPQGLCCTDSGCTGC